MDNIYIKFLNDFKADVTILNSNNINEYFLLRNRIISLYQDKRYDEMLENIRIFSMDIMNPTDKIYDLIDDYILDIKSNLNSTFNKLLNDSSLSNIGHNVVSNMVDLFDSTLYVPDIKVRLFSSYLDILQNLGLDVSKLRSNINLYFYANKIIKTNVINKEKIKVVDMAISGLNKKTSDIIEIQNKKNNIYVDDAIKSDVSTLTKYLNMYNNDSESKNDKDILFDEASDALGYKIEISDEHLNDIISHQKKIVENRINTNNLAKKVIDLKTKLDKLGLFLSHASIKDKSIVKNITNKFNDIKTELSSAKKEYRESKNKNSIYKYELEVSESDFLNSIKDISFVIEDKKGINFVIDSIKNVKQKIISKFKTGKKSKFKKKAAALISAGILAFLNQALDISNIKSSALANTAQLHTYMVDNNLSLNGVGEYSFYGNVDDIISQLKECDDAEIKNYMTIIEKLNFSSNSKGEIRDSMLYVLGICASNWEENCKVFGVNETWQQRVSKIIDTIEGVSSVSMVDKKDVNWSGITYGVGENLSDMSIELNQHYKGDITSLLHEGAHTEQKVSGNSSKIHELKIGDMPNQLQISHFLEEGEANFIQGLAEPNFLEYGFDSYDDIEGQTFGLILMVGSNEYMDFITGKNSSESFVDFVTRRFLEQGYTQEFAWNYLIALQNSNIGTLNNYGVSLDKRIDNYSSEFGRIANDSYLKAIDDYKKNPIESFSKNYKTLSDIVGNVLIDRLEHSNTKDEVINSLYGLGIYYDHIVGNDILYVDRKSIGLGRKSSSDKVKYINEDREDIRKETFAPIFNKMYDACSNDVIDNFELPYDRFEKMFKKTGNATDFIDSINSYNDQYLWEKENDVIDKKKEIGDVPNVLMMSEFLSDGSSIFSDGISYNSIKSAENKGITPIYIGLGLVTGFDELDEFIEKNEKNESLENFINRRCGEQGFDKGSQYIVSLQNSLIGRFDHDVNDRTNFVDTGFGTIRNIRYEQAKDKTYQENYDDYSKLVYEMMNKKLRSAKTDDEKLEAFEYMGIYVDYVSGNEMHYDEKYNVINNKSRSKEAKQSFNDASETMYNIYDSIGNNNEILSFEEFTDIYNKSGKATKYYDNLNIKNEDKKTTITPDDKETKVKPEKTTITPDDKETKVKPEKTIITPEVRETKVKPEKTIITPEVRETKVKPDDNLSKSKVILDTKKYFDVILEYDIYPKEQIYGFVDRFTDFVKEDKISVTDANNMLNDIKNGKISLMSSFVKLSSIEKNNIKEQGSNIKTR